MWLQATCQHTTDCKDGRSTNTRWELIRNYDSRIASNGISAAFRIAVLAGFHELFGFAESRRVNKDDVLLFWCGIEEILSHGKTHD